MTFDGKAFGIQIVQAVKDHTAPIIKRLEEAERRLAEVEGRGLKYSGTYQRACNYSRGECVTFDGSLFIALRDVGPEETPATGIGWQLAVKRGKDAGK